MGQQSSKSAEGHTNHSSSSSNTNSRKELKAPPNRRSHNHNANTASPLPSEKASHIKNYPNPTPHSNPHSNPHSSPTSPQRKEETSSMGTAPSKEKWIDERKKEKSRSGGKSTPVKVPRGSDPRRQRGPDSQFEPSGPPRNPNYIPHSNLNFPPRLPLPIEEELHAPGSPIITAEGFSSSLHEDDIDGLLPRQSSTFSNTTLEDDALDELQAHAYETPRGTVPTLIQWPKDQGGEKVYVTGTFINWSRKFRMHRDANGVLSAVIQFPPGTHHVKFIVDGEMQLSKELPTAVDFTNILVNYIEVSVDDILKEKPEQHVPPGVYPPQVLQEPGTTEAKDHARESVGKNQLIEGEPKAEPVLWGKEMPKYLRDVDLPEYSKRYKRAARGITEFPTPPGLPLFLGKSILNGTTPMKDDSSVLNMPNHTVLNHLATSSIKNEVLATSITTRYKRKYVTTIVYKPTESTD